MDRKLALLEAMLFTTTGPLTIEEIAKSMKTQTGIIADLLEQLRKKYNDGNSGIRLSDTGGYKLVVKADYLNKVSHLTPHADLSRGLLRVLAIIVYHEPIKQSDIVKIVGNRTYEYTKELRERGMIKSERKGRTMILTTTPKFEEYFDVDKDELKSLIKQGHDKGVENERNDESGNSPNSERA